MRGKERTGIHIVHLRLDVGYVDVRIPVQVRTEFRHVRHAYVMDILFHPVDAFTLHLEVDRNVSLVTQRVRLDDIYSVGIQRVQYVPQFAEYDCRIVYPTQGSFRHILLYLGYFQVGHLVPSVLVVFEPCGYDGADGRYDRCDVFHCADCYTTLP